MSAHSKRLDVDQVHVFRGDRHVLQGVSLKLEAGEIVHVRGPNGTGKTTLLRVASGLLRPEQGSVRWGGRAIGEVRAEYQAALAYASHEPALKSDLTGLENLRFTVGLKRSVADAELREALEQAGVAGCADLPVRVLSAGQRRRVTMARILAMRAALWLLDEPFTNLDTVGGQLLTQMLDEHLRQGGSALVVAHQAVTLKASVRPLDLAA
jgi:heme exporter protein A